MQDNGQFHDDWDEQFVDAAWTNMRKQLDEELPVAPEKGREKKPYWFSLFPNDYPIRFQNSPEPVFHSNHQPTEGEKENDELLDNLKQIYQHRRFVVQCHGPGLNKTCHDLFYPTLTNNGICHVFNGRSLDEDMITNQYIKDSTMSLIPITKTVSFLTKTVARPLK